MIPFVNLSTTDRDRARHSFEAIVIAAVDLHREGWYGSHADAIVWAAGSLGLRVWPALVGQIGREVRDELR